MTAVAEQDIVNHVMGILSKDMPEPRIAVVGCGGAGCNIAGKVRERSVLELKTIAINSDEGSLNSVVSDTKIRLGRGTEHSQGGQGDPDIGRDLARAARDSISSAIQADIAFLIVGLGGGIGTGAAPVVSKVVRESGAVVIAIPVLPFSIEGRDAAANDGLRELRSASDSTIVLENDSLLKFGSDVPLVGAFSILNGVIAGLIECVVERISRTFLTVLEDEVVAMAKNIQVAVDVQESGEGRLSPLPPIEAQGEIQSYPEEFNAFDIE
jgi:cell division protein FtsZ